MNEHEQKETKQNQTKNQLAAVISVMVNAANNTNNGASASAS